MIHPVKDSSRASETDVDVVLEFTCFLYDPAYVGNLIFLFENQLINLDVLDSITAEA